MVTSVTTTLVPVPSEPADRASQPHSAAGDGSRVPAPLLVAAVLVSVEALALAALGAAELASLRSSRLAMGLSTAVFFVAGSLGLGLCAWGLARARRLARGPVLMTQLVALGLAWNLRAGETRPVAAALAVVAVVVLAAMLQPTSVAALEEDDPARGEAS